MIAEAKGPLQVSERWHLELSWQHDGLVECVVGVSWAEIAYPYLPSQRGEYFGRLVRRCVDAVVRDPIKDP